MKTIRELKIKDWSGYFFKVILMKMMFHILFLTILNVFLKNLQSIVIQFFVKVIKTKT